MTIITKEIRNEIKNAYRPLKRAYELKGTVFCSEFDRATTLSSRKMNRMIDTLRQSSYDLWKLGLLDKGQYETMNETADKLQNFVSLAVQHFNNLEKNKDAEAYFGRDYDYLKETRGYSESEFVGLFGTKEDYIKGMIEDSFDFECLDDDLKAMMQCFNLLK